MKSLSGTTLRRLGKSNNSVQLLNNFTAQPLFYVIILLTTFLFTACKKYAAAKPDSEDQTIQNTAINTDAELRSHYSGLNPQTLSELQQVRAATAKYQNINNAFNDGYDPIPVVVMPQMGYHFLKAESVSPVFDLRKPAFLVYNKRANGSFELLAAEYGVPMSSLPLHVAPEGFTGDADVWDENTLNSGLWTLHAWVWKDNPEGVFNMTNPLVIVR